MSHRVDRYQITFVMGDGEKGSKMDKILTQQTERIGKILGSRKLSQQAALRVALRTMAKAKDRELDIEDEKN